MHPLLLCQAFVISVLGASTRSTRTTITKTVYVEAPETDTPDSQTPTSSQTITPSRTVLPSPTVSPSSRVWQPQVQSRFQIILDRAVVSSGKSESSERSGPFGLFSWTRGGRERGEIDGKEKEEKDILIPENADVFDVDLFETSKESVQTLKRKGKRVICYFSAGGSESWRSDYGDFRSRDLGDGLKNWKDERWLDIRSDNVFNIMKKRIEMAASKGCDGIDPDNVDAFGDEHTRGGGFDLTKEDSIEYIKRLAAEAHSKYLSIGLKNAEAILANVSAHIEYAVNEECAIFRDGCHSYEDFINSGKPVFHIEYAKTKVKGESVELYPENDSDREVRDMNGKELQKLYCLQRGLDGRKLIREDTAKKFSTVIKALKLNKWVLYCDGTSAGDATDAAA